MPETSKTLIAGVGYSDMSDLSFGPRMVERLRDMSWPGNVRVEDMSYGPIAVLHWFEDRPEGFGRAIFFGAEERGREPGTLSIYPRSAEKPDPELVQACVSEAVTGVISLENLLVVTRHFGALPADTTVVDLEPAELEWGQELSPAGEERMAEALSWVRREVDLTSTGNGHREEVRVNE